MAITSCGFDDDISISFLLIWNAGINRSCNEVASGSSPVRDACSSNFASAVLTSFMSLLLSSFGTTSQNGSPFTYFEVTLNKVSSETGTLSSIVDKVHVNGTLEAWS